MKRGLRGLLVAAAMSMAGPAAAQDITVETTRSLTPERPYSLTYPAFMKLGTGSADLQLDMPEAALGLPADSVQVELTIIPNVPPATAQEVADHFDTDAVVAEWRKTFPDFAFGRPVLAETRSGKVLAYNATLTSRAPGAPKLVLVRVEERAGGRRYLLDFYVDRASYERARVLVGFIIANFSTSSERAQCCADPTPIP
jgi:hypothetical protein